MFKQSMTDRQRADRFARENNAKKRNIDRRAKRRQKAAEQDWQMRIDQAQQIIDADPFAACFR